MLSVKWFDRGGELASPELKGANWQTGITFRRSENSALKFLYTLQSDADRELYFEEPEWRFQFEFRY